MSLTQSILLVPEQFVQSETRDWFMVGREDPAEPVVNHVSLLYLSECLSPLVAWPRPQKETLDLYDCPPADSSSANAAITIF